jgi:hypothetical protein
MAQLVKTVHGLAIASVKTVMGLAIASVKSVMGVDNTAAASEDITSNLIGWWKLDEGTGTACADSSASDNDGTAAGSPAWGTDGNIRTNCLIFDGSNDIVSTAGAAPFGTGDLTLAVWAKTGTIGSYQFCRMIDDYNTHIGMTQAGGYYSCYASRDRTGTVAQSGTIATPGDWHHYAVTFQASADTCILYVDGAASPNSTPQACGAESAGYAVGLGARYDSVYSYVGRMQDARVYTRVLTAAQVAALYAWRP